MEPLISVIIPVYNVEKYLVRCVTSVCNQSYGKLEIILVDDGSPDECGMICDRLAENDERIRVVHKENGGLSSARNAGIEIAQGEYLFFLDSDDYISNDCIRYLFELLVRGDSDIAVGNYLVTSEDNVDFSKKNRMPITERNYSNVEAINQLFSSVTVKMVTAWMKLYKRELFDEIRFPEGLLHEDEATTYQVYYRSKKIAVSDKFVYAYYSNPESITRAIKPKSYSDKCIIFQEQITFFEVNGEWRLADRVRNRWCIQIAAHLFPLGYFDERKRMVKLMKTVYKEITDFSGVPFGEKVKGWLCVHFCTIMAWIIYQKQKRRLSNVSG